MAQLEAQIRDKEARLENKKRDLQGLEQRLENKRGAVTGLDNSGADLTFFRFTRLQGV